MLAYQAAGLPPPKKIIWTRSPLEGVIAAAWQVVDPTWSQVREPVLDPVLDQVLGQVRNQVMGQVIDQVMGQVIDQVLWQVMGQVREQVRSQVREQVLEQVRDRVLVPVREQALRQVRSQALWQVRSQVGELIQEAAYGQHDVNWLAFFDAFREFGISEAEKLQGLNQIAENAGWFWTMSEFCIITERPISIHRDDNNRLHNPDGLAIEYPDGFGVYALHGVTVDKKYIENFESLTAHDIQEIRDYATLLET